jgi:hypothetical protein
VPEHVLDRSELGSPPWEHQLTGRYWRLGPTDASAREYSRHPSSLQVFRDAPPGGSSSRLNSSTISPHLGPNSIAATARGKRARSELDGMRQTEELAVSDCQATASTWLGATMASGPTCVLGAAQSLGLNLRATGRRGASLGTTLAMGPWSIVNEGSTRWPSRDGSMDQVIREPVDHFGTGLVPSFPRRLRRR